VLVGAEAQAPYNRPPLSKGYLRARTASRSAGQARELYAEQRIALELGVRATKIDAGQKLVELEGGRRLAYDRLLVATGGATGPCRCRARICLGFSSCAPSRIAIGSAPPSRAAVARS